MKKAFGILLLLIFTGSFAFTQPEDFKPGSEPSGFRGIPWGEPLSALKQMRLTWDGGERKYYEREEDLLELGGARLRRIVYVFWEEKFSEVRLDILRDYNNLQDEFADFKTLRGVCFERFGTRRKPIFGGETYSWYGHTSWLRLIRDDPGVLSLTMGSTKLLEQRKSHEDEQQRSYVEVRKQKATKGIGF